MNVYVLGAGVSAPLGYPVGNGLFPALDSFVRNYRREKNRFDFSDWPNLCERLAQNESFLIRRAYQSGHLELLMTALDQYKMMTEESIKKHDFYEDPNSWDRRTLLFALAEYFQHKHYEDLSSFRGQSWSDVKHFAERVEPGDTVITFNYDSCMERALLGCDKWSPRDGFGFPIDFVEPAAKELAKSRVRVLHLHGSTGWYKKHPSYLGSGDISVSQEFLACLGLHYTDCTLTELSDQSEVFMHPTYLKTFTGALIELWRSAAQALRAAQRIFIIGYSCPAADGAALGLLLGASEPKKITIVNKTPSDARRLSELLGTGTIFGPRTFADWLKQL